MSDDLDLLRQYEPILRFTHGELFFPTAADGYVEQCSLWLDRPNHEPELLADAGDLTLDRLARLGAAFPGQYLYLRFVQRPLSRLDFERWLRRPDRPVFRSRGRLARVGLVARLIDAAFSVSLFLRGTVPGGTAAAAQRQYAQLLEQSPGYCYYGRVVRDGGYIILQYLFFYVMNDWRSSFYGANDHEADWEQVFVYLDASCTDRPPAPAWVAYASHGYAGDALRRRWDDPELMRFGDHPVAYIAAGSHAAYFQPGEYITRVEVGFLRPVFRVVDVLERVWRNTLRQGESRELTERVQSLLSVPFVEYARGDGVSIGPGQPARWTPLPISDQPAWVDDYRGLWGLDTRDPFPGERAPAGPKYTSSGTIRRTWHDPLGWAGLGKVAPPRVARDVLANHLAELRAQCAAIEEQIAVKRREARRDDLEVQALRTGGYSGQLLRERQEALADHEDALRALERQHAGLLVTMDACRDHLAQISAGDFGDPRSHLRGRYVPTPEPEHALRRLRLAEIWSAVSVGVLMLVIALLAVAQFTGVVAAMAASAGLFVVIESSFHRRLRRLLLNVTVLLALVTSIILVYEFFVEILIAGAIALAVLIISDNVRELRGR